MGTPSNAHHRPSLIIESTISPLPMRRPSRTRGIRYGQLLIDSMPPATTTSTSPVAMPWAASITAFRPEPQTLLMLSAATESDRPPRSAACRAGFCPRPALTTLPMMHSSTMSGSMPARRTASATTSAPSCGAVNPFKDPRNFPVPVRTALTITASCRLDTDGQLADHLVAEECLQAFQDDVRRTRDLSCPGGGFRVDQQGSALEAHERAAIHGRPDDGFPRKGEFTGRHRRLPEKRRDGLRNGLR